MLVSLHGYISGKVHFRSVNNTLEFIRCGCIEASHTYTIGFKLDEERG